VVRVRPPPPITSSYAAVVSAGKSTSPERGSNAMDFAGGSKRRYEEDKDGRQYEEDRGGRRFQHRGNIEGRREGDPLREAPF